MMKNNIRKTMILALTIISSTCLNIKLEARGGGWGAGLAGGLIGGALIANAANRPSEVYYVPQPPQQPPRYNYYDDYEYTRRLRDHNQRLREDQRRLMEENRQLREETKKRQENVSIAQENRDLRTEQQKYRRPGE